jgi:putative ABC transport system permease protein
MSVLRRRGEIGLRRAVGATRRAIVAQFLCEGILVCGAGGAAGVLAGLAATIALAAMADWPLASLSTAALAGLAASVCVGLAAASYPAWQAARVDSMRVLA